MQVHFTKSWLSYHTLKLHRSFHGHLCLPVLYSLHWQSFAAALVDDSWLSFLRPRDFDILILDAVLYIPGNEEAQRTVKINIADISPPACQSCTACPVPGNLSKQWRTHTFITSNLCSRKKLPSYLLGESEYLNKQIHILLYVRGISCCYRVWEHPL